MTATYHRLGAATAGDNTILALPREWKPDGSRPGVILAGGHGDTYTIAQNPAAAQPLIARLTAAGFPVVVSDLGGSLWGNVDAVGGNPSAVTRLAALRGYLQSAAIGAKAGPVLGIGFSMGSLSLLNYAANQPSHVSGIVAGCPVVDVALVKSSGYAGSLDAAYDGGWSEGTYGSVSNPKTMAAAGKYAGLPILLRYAPDDPLITPISVTNFAASVGSTASAAATNAVGHSWPVLTGQTRPDEILAFLAARL